MVRRSVAGKRAEASRTVRDARRGYLRGDRLASESSLKLNTFNDSWVLKLDICPCDEHFRQYVAERQVTGKNIFHFGTGNHHLVGQNHNGNHVLGVTASQDEYTHYMNLIVEN